MATLGILLYMTVTLHFYNVIIGQWGVAYNKKLEQVASLVVFHKIFPYLQNEIVGSAKIILFLTHRQTKV